MSKIRGIIALIQFSITVGILIILMTLFKKHNHKLRKIWSSLQIKLLGIKLDVVGTIDESCNMLMLNHQSLLDIVVLENLHSKNIAWVGKKQISDLIFFGNIMKAPNMITIDREDKTGIVTLLKEGKNRLEDGRPIAIFPEGTRSNGTYMRDFKAGAKILADKYNLKVQPIILLNTNKVLDSQKLTATPGVIKVIFLEPITASKSSDWFEKTQESMREIFYKELSS